MVPLTPPTFDIVEQGSVEDIHDGSSSECASTIPVGDDGAPLKPPSGAGPGRLARHSAGRLYFPGNFRRIFVSPRGTSGIQTGLTDKYGGIYSVVVAHAGAAPRAEAGLVLRIAAEVLQRPHPLAAGTVLLQARPLGVE